MLSRKGRRRQLQQPWAAWQLERIPAVLTGEGAGVDEGKRNSGGSLLSNKRSTASCARGRGVHVGSRGFALFTESWL